MEGDCCGAIRRELWEMRMRMKFLRSAIGLEKVIDGGC